MTDIRFTPTGFARFVLLTIVSPEGTSDGGDTAKKRAIELMEAAGLTQDESQQLLDEWLDQPGDLPDDDSLLVKAMAVGAKKLLVDRPTDNKQKRGFQ